LTSDLPVRAYVAAGGVIVEPDSRQVLVLLRRGRLGPDAKPEIRLPKGHVEPGESHAQAALREVAEEAGLADLEILADLGHQTVEFDWQGYHYVRQEYYFLMEPASAQERGVSEEQFERRWLAWEEALGRMTFDAEREWVRRAQRAWANVKRKSRSK
jgi:8-oxo-dGTP pyrophosphatase MutT (NUDIX family)